MRWITVLAAAVLLAGCGPSPDANKVTDADVTEPASSEQSQTAKGSETAWPTDVTVHRNAKGEVECPVMKNTIGSPDKAVGYEDYDGVRYYFCCDMCPGKFKENPGLYAEKTEDKKQANG